VLQKMSAGTRSSCPGDMFAATTAMFCNGRLVSLTLPLS
jgi:hypothetical protein